MRARLEEEVQQLRNAKRALQAEANRASGELKEKLQATRRSLRAETRRANREGARAEKLDRQLKAANKELKELREKLEKAQRENKRQATPFSKGDPKPDPKKPGRKKGAKYGKRGERPRPERIDEIFESPLPEACPDCGGAVVETAVHEQFVTDIPPVQPHTTQFNVHVGCCEKCGKRVQGRHPRQHSDALGAAANQIGPVAQALAAHLNKLVGASYVKIADFFLAAWGISVTPSTLTRALKRLADKGDPAYQQIAEAIRQSPAVYPDETGWKVGGLKSWLWAFVGEDATLYTIQFSRGFEVAAAILGEDWDGALGHDGWAPYDRFSDALHQQCLGHLLRRCNLILESATRGAVRFPSAIKAILKDALALRDRHEADEITDHGLLSAIGRLEARLEVELARSLSYEPNRKFAAHLRKHKAELFTFLRLRVCVEFKGELEATNWPAEQAIRPAVINRKTSGGNRSPVGAVTQAVLTTIFRTCQQRKLDPIQFLVGLLRSIDPGQYSSTALGP
ncbi:MAG: IS66 family transposase [Candidatus Wallbacteria bacterium]|nr:IS66 family transposase [Candidatus Wallbacteria bacterium]